MGKNVDHIQHIKSNIVVEIDGVKSPKLPNPSALTEGELAINYAKDYETISLKNESGDVVTFSSDKKFYTKDEIDDTERATSAALNELNRRKLDASAYTPTDLSNYYQKSETSGSTQLSTAFGAIDTKVGSGFTSSSITDVIISNERIVATALNDLNENKLDASAYTPTDLSNYYTKSETSGATELSTAFNSKQNTLMPSGSITIINDAITVDVDQTIDGTTSGSSNPVSTSAVYSALTNVHIDVDQTIDSGTSASTNAVSTSAVYGFVTSYTPSITVDQVLDDTTSASTNPVSSKAVYDAVTDNELVWTNAYVTLSGTVSAHTADTSIHLVSGDREKLNSITGTFGTMAYEDKTSYSSATEVNTALADKLDTTAYTPSVELWVSGTGENAVAQKGGGNTASGKLSVAMGSGTTASGNYSVSEGFSTTASDSSSHAEGYGTKANGYSSHAEGQYTIASGSSSHAEGYYTTTNNQSEHASGQYNISNSATTTFGDSGNTLFSVGNGTYGNNHNAFEIRQNGDIYIVNKNGQDVKLQDEIGNITIDQTIDSGTSASTNAVSTKAVYDFVTNDFYTKDEIDDAEYVRSMAINDLKINKLDASAYTPTDLSNYYQKSETSGATELSTAFADKQDVLSAGTGVEISGNVISVTGGSSVVVDQTIISGSTNPVAGGAVYDAIGNIELLLSQI